MIADYSIKFSPAVSQKELEKILSQPIIAFEGGDKELHSGQVVIASGSTHADLKSRLYKTKARIDLVGDFEDLVRINEFISKLKQ